MKHASILAVFLASSLVLSAGAVDKIEDFLGLKFGSRRPLAKETLLARGSKLKDEKTPDMLTFTDGTYAGEKITELALHFVGDYFDAATVTIKFSTNKSAERGLGLYDTIRKALTEKYGAPTTAPSIARGKNFAEKAKGNQLETIWQSKDTLTGEYHSITLRVPEMGMYDWVFKVIYQDHNVKQTQKEAAPRKDI